MEEFFHCYYPDEITQSKGMYSFVPRSPLLRLVCDTPDSNRNWKSRYFSWKVMNGCVVLVILNICPSTQHGA